MPVQIGGKCECGVVHRHALPEGPGVVEVECKCGRRYEAVGVRCSSCSTMRYGYVLPSGSLGELCRACQVGTALRRTPSPKGPGMKWVLWHETGKSS